MDPDLPLKQAVSQARRREVRAAVHSLYAELATVIAQRRPRCNVSGRCCHFDAYGHRLYVTTAELATFLDDVHGNRFRDGPDDGPGDPRWASSGNPNATSATARRTSLPQCRPASCPFLEGGLCSVHVARPFGCRVFYCDADAKAWMNATYETFHGKFQQLHEQLGLAYHYVEWRDALRELGADGTAADEPRGQPGQPGF